MIINDYALDLRTSYPFFNILEYTLATCKQQSVTHKRLIYLTFAMSSDCINRPQQQIVLYIQVCVSAHYDVPLKVNFPKDVFLEMCCCCETNHDCIYPKS